MRVLYVARDRAGHDNRFATAWASAGAEIEMLAASDPTSDAESDSFEARIRAAITRFLPDVVQAGPVTDVASAVTQSWAGPLIATSWGFDLMRDIDLDAHAAEQARDVIIRADAVLVDNDGPRSRALALGAVPEAVVQFPWGVNLGDFQPDGDDLRSRIGWDADEFIVLSTRSHETIYDVSTVIDGFARAAADRDGLRLLVAGSGSMTDQLTAQAAATGFADRIQFLGNVGAHELPSLYRTGNLYVSASVVDGTSVSLLEAMASGTPVCVSRIAGNAQWVNTKTGFDFAVGNPAELGQRIGEVFDPAMSDDVDSRNHAALAMVQRDADWSDAPHKLLELARLAEKRNAVARIDWIRP